MLEPKRWWGVRCRKFEWSFRYRSAGTLETLPTNWKSTGHKVAEDWEKKPQADDVHVVNAVHIWKGAKVRMYLKTRDVLHSFFLPNLRIKQDALPGKTIPVYFDATEANVKWNADKKQFESVGKEKDW